MYLLHDVHHRLAVKHRFGLNGFQLQRPFLATANPHLLGQRVLRAQLRLHPLDRLGRIRQVALTVDPRADGVIGQLRLVVHFGAVDGGTGQRGVGIKHHLGHHGQPVHTEVERG